MQPTADHPNRDASGTSSLARVALWLPVVLMALVLRVAALPHTDLAPHEIRLARLAAPPVTPWAALAAAWSDDPLDGVTPMGALLANAGWWLIHPFAGDLPRSPGWLRLPFVAAGLLAVGFLGAAARRAAGPRVGIAASVLMACSVFPIIVARDAGPAVWVLCAGTAALRCLVEVAQRAETSRYWLAAFVLSLLAAVAVSPGAFVWALGSAAGLGVLARASGPDIRRLRPWLACAAGTAALGALAWIAAPSPPSIGQGPRAGWAVSALGSLFWGHSVLALAPTFVLLLAGAAACWRADARRAALRAILASAVVTAIVVAWAGTASLHTAGWLVALAPVAYLLAALGLEALCSGWAEDKERPGASWRVGAGLVAAVVVPGVLFMPTVYALPAKGQDYGGVARWLQANVRPGTPYLLEDAGERIFLEDQGRTPHHVAAVPDPGGAQCADVQRQREGLREMALRFPEAPLVRAAPTGRDPASRCGAWAWPDDFYRQRVELRNDALRQVLAWGLWPDLAYGRSRESQCSAVILYNAPADVEAWVRVSGAPVQFLYDQWVCGPARPGMYARVRPRAWGTVEVRSFRDGSQRGQFRLRGALAEEGVAELPLEMRWMGQTMGVTNVRARVPFEFMTGQVVVPRRGGAFGWGVAGRETEAPGLLVLLDLEFVPSPVSP